MDLRRWEKAIVLGRLVLTVTNQASGAPIIDECAGRTRENRAWRGRAIHLSPWRKNRYGDRERGKALCIGVVKQ